ncbi:MAG: PDZ domain-containing protein, partial [Pirellulaceae bacterium]
MRTCTHSFQSFFGSLVVLHGLLMGASAHAQGTRLLRDPDVSRNKIVFVYADDLWTVGREGGKAKRLTSGEGAETNPTFSKDGQWIAFTGQYAGNTDVYVVPADGGQPKRLTWHPGRDVAQGWTPDGKILFQSGREGQPTKLWKFYTVDTEGGYPEALALPQAYQGEMSANGKWIAYQEISLWDAEWRNYRGGQAQPIGIASTDNWKRTTTPWEGERHLSPVWLGNVIYYLSERDYASNLWSYNPRTKQEKQLTHHTDFDVKSVGAGAGCVVYEQGGYLHRLNPKTGKSKQLVIEVAGDLNYSRPRWEEISAGSLRDARLSPTGKRALFESRGELFTVPVDKGSWRNLTRTAGIADRHAVWSPDGQQIAWFQDKHGEYSLVIANQQGELEREIEIPGATFFFRPEWSPNGKKLAFTDTHYRVWVLDLESEKLTHADTDLYAHPQRTMNPVWSPDSKWIAYAKRLKTQLRVIALYNVESEEQTNLTNGMADSISPVWDASGKYLYFLSSTDFALNIGWLDMTSYDRPISRSLYIAILAEDGKSPFLERSDEEESAKEAESDSSTDETNDVEVDSPSDEQDDNSVEEAESKEEHADSKDDKDASVQIDFDGIASRIVDAPGLPSANYVELLNGPEGHVFVIEAPANSGGNTLHRYSVDEKKPTEFAKSVRYATVSHDRKHILVQSGGWSTGSTAGTPKLKPLKIDGIRAKIDPRLEWNQMLREGWRFMRDFLYVDNVHGAPWDEVWQWYSPWLEDVNHRSDFNYLLDILSGEVSVGHSYVVGGDLPDLPSPRTGLLGCDLKLVGKRYQISKIYSGEQWTPGLASPLSTPGLGVEEGDYLISIDGVSLEAPTSPFELLEGTAGKTIALGINSKPSPEDAAEVTV